MTGGTRVAAECEPVRFGSETVGAMIRLVVGLRRSGEAAPTGARRRPRVGWGSLSAAQLGVAELVATGLTNQQAATRLYVSPHTIDFHLRQIFNKLGINSRVESGADRYRAASRTPKRSRKRGVEQRTAALTTFEARIMTASQAMMNPTANRMRRCRTALRGRAAELAAIGAASA